LLAMLVARRANRREHDMSDLKPELRDYRLTTAEIIYHLPDHPDLLQSFIWQKLDVAPDFPELCRFLEFWSRNIEGRLHSVKIGQARFAGRPRFRHVRASLLLH
jgi:uncharacterized protein Usg